MADKKNILIIFDGQHLAFSPTITQLYDMLSVDHQVTIIAESSTNFIKEKLTGRNVIYYQVIRRKPTFIYKLYYLLLAAFNPDVKYLRKKKIKFPEYFYRFRLLKKTLAKTEYDKVIAVDIKNFFYCTLFKQKVDFLSLELGMNEKLLPFTDASLINCIITQSKERRDYLFPDSSLKTFYIQNSPVFKEVEIPVKKMDCFMEALPGILLAFIIA